MCTGIDIKMSQGLCCCSPCRPAYKRHVDSIYPAIPEDGLVKTKMETLVYYAMTSPEKLDRIGEYLEQRISRDIYRGRNELVGIGIEAMDQLLSACHARTLTLFVESFLKTIQKMLESSDADLQILASASFKKFSTIEEETPSYHRTYDFFIDRFAQMCHSELNDAEKKRRLRCAGLLGLLGVIRKTVNEDLAENIWEPKHMDKIVPSLLYNMDAEQVPRSTTHMRDTPELSGPEKETPSQMAETILRELVSSASGSTVKAVLAPVLKHCDNHSLWEESRQPLAVHIFEAIMFSIQIDHSYIVIERNISHIERTISLVQKSNMAQVLSKIIGIGVSDSTVGPGVMEIITALLRNLERSVRAAPPNEDQGALSPILAFQDGILRSLGEYTAKMPDFQKTENMTLILSKVPLEAMLPEGRLSQVDTDVQHIFMKALYMVAEKQTRETNSLFSSTFSNQLLMSLLRLLQASDGDVRLLVLNTFQILVDRHGNIEKLAYMSTSPSNLGLYMSADFKRADQHFAQKSLYRIYASFKTVLIEQNNTKEFLEAIYTTVALLSVEMAAIDESAFCLLDFIESIQNIAVQETALTTDNRLALHSVAVCLLALLGTLMNVPAIDDYVIQLLTIRADKAPHLLPPLKDEYNPDLDPNNLSPEILINPTTVKDELKNAGKSVQFVSGLTRTDKPGSPHMNWHEPHILPTINRRPSTVSSSSIGLDAGDSTSSSPMIVHRPIPEEVSIKAFKKILEGPSQRERDDEEAKRKKIQDTFLHAEFDELCSLVENQGSDLQSLISHIFATTNIGVIGADDTLKQRSILEEPEPYEKIFPELFLY